MFHKSLFYLSLFFLFTFSACENEVELEEVLSGTMELKWKRCGFYHNQISAKINFNQTDSLNDGWYLEDGDTSFFYFTITGNETILIDSSSNTEWIGELSVSKFSNNSLEFQKATKFCDSELYYFE